MSDGFDKEAEREKLREKFANDDEKREHTQRMSELLLQGATMTNRHCDDCGDPIFRHDGQEFCPTCQASEADDESAARTPAEADGRSSQPDAAGVESEHAADATESTSSETTSVSPTAAPSDLTAPEPQAETRANEPVDSRGHGGVNPRASEPDTSAVRSRTAARRPDASGTVADARASLTETLVRFAREAESTDDPRRAREHLQTAREAAETLAALE
ncbi:Sjogren's syndrome/scleroderma autoantigen 1 family protein [Halorubrum laminariae]|uniref:Sjogren's syndrome/scleroderma autoantigen 1 family protein n=1 Tax=Halorubrum laminariae TaxID=1433523 RepID=A0ABD6BXC1_9EURY|nr:Sjogren's syndrome/scleroderma autoantigen 1 family protein [Halorubrum laminariae]